MKFLNNRERGDPETFRKKKKLIKKVPGIRSTVDILKQYWIIETIAPKFLRKMILRPKSTPIQTIKYKRRAKTFSIPINIQNIYLPSTFS